mmetsp:Transcript_27931/g.57954  ORF Transcript_27931/g.57954 Transcript_27931/m.57954 type:complete len:476 (+) Transcript_27931:33-1460(+)
MPLQHHVVFMNVAATGHMNPTLPLVAELRARGCEVTYFVEDTMRSVVEAAGAVWLPFRNPYDDKTGTPVMLHKSGIAKYVPEGTSKDEYAGLPSSIVYTAEMLLPALLEDLRTLPLRPSLIVHDPFLAFGQVAGHALGVPAVTTLTMPGPGLMCKPDELVDRWESQPWVSGPQREILQKYGFDVLRHGMQLECYSPTLNLVTTIDELYVPPRPGRQMDRFGTFPFSCIGVLTDPKVKRVANANVKEDGAQQLDLDELDSALKFERQLLYISLGTVASSEHFWVKPFGHFGRDNGLEECTGKELTQHVFRACFEAFGDASESATLVVLSIGPQEDVLEGLPAVPPNFRLHKAVPQLDVLRRSSAFITHGGANSMHESLSLGVPMAVVPIFGDQPLNADSLEALGAAISFRQPLKSVTPEALAVALEKLMQPDRKRNPFRAATQSMTRKLQAAKSVPAATDALLEVSAVRTAAIAGA